MTRDARATWAWHRGTGSVVLVRRGAARPGGEHYVLLRWVHKDKP